jgi:hypothetical protein
VFETLSKVLDTQLRECAGSRCGRCKGASSELERDTGVEDQVKLAPEPAGVETTTHAFPQEPAKLRFAKLLTRSEEVWEEVRVGQRKVTCPPQLIEGYIDLEEDGLFGRNEMSREVEGTLTPRLWFGVYIGDKRREC